ncbi:MAG: insulinase family protein [Muribaculaceae bacterium]|nr:insulinase family protein [Muribaculaceae bacterium]
MRSKHSEVSTGVLSNGIRVVHTLWRGSAVAIFGVTVKAGSRNESQNEHGLAHFVEHTIFKGTGHRRACHIINRMEAVGGELNAFTTKEETVIYSVFPSGNLVRAVELIADLVSDSRFPEHELAKEREVVADEIDSYLDSPSEAIFDDFEDYIFSGSPLGHNILGTTESLKNFDSATCRDFIERNYTTGNMVAFYSGPRSANVVFSQMERYLSAVAIRKRDNISQEITPKINASFDRTHMLATHQTHCIIGTRVPSYLDDRRYATALLANIMGGPGMNSLLNVALRERRGLVYNVEVSTALFSDCGIMTVYFGCDPSDTERCREIVFHEFDCLETTLTPKRLDAAKRQYLGQLVIASENRENSALGMARSLLWRNEMIEPSVTESAIYSLTIDDVIEAAKPMMNPSMMTFSPESAN